MVLLINFRCLSEIGTIKNLKTRVYKRCAPLFLGSCLCLGKIGENGDEKPLTRRNAMAHSNLPQPSITKSQQASSVSPLHQSGSTAMSVQEPVFPIDKALYKLYQNLRNCNLRVIGMVAALNFVLRQYEGASIICTCDDLECFITEIEMYETEMSLI